MKKLLFVFAVAAFTACGSGETPATNADSATKAATEMVDSTAKAATETVDSAAKAGAAKMDSSAKSKMH